MILISKWNNMENIKISRNKSANKKHSEKVKDIIKEDESRNPLEKKGVKISKIADKSIAIAGERVEYTIFLENLDEQEYKNLVVIDLLCDKIVFVPETIKINKKADKNANIISGTIIDKILPKEKITIEFQAYIKEGCNSGDTYTKAKLIYEEEASNSILFEDESNISYIKIEKPEIAINICINKNSILIGEEVKFNLNIKNIGTTSLFNVIIRNNISEAFKFVNDSFKLNGTYINFVDLLSGVNIGSLDINEEKNLEFKLKYEDGRFEGDILNLGTISYRYKLYKNILSKNEIRINYHLKVNCLSPNFKEDFIEATISIPPMENLPIKNVNKVTVEPIIKTTYILDTLSSESEEGISSIRHKLVVIGMLNYMIEYVYDDTLERVYFYDYKKPFSAYIIMPKNFDKNSNTVVDVQLEDVYYKEMNSPNVYVATSLIFKAKIIN